MSNMEDLHPFQRAMVWAMIIAFFTILGLLVLGIVIRLFGWALFG